MQESDSRSDSDSAAPQSDTASVLEVLAGLHLSPTCDPRRARVALFYELTQNHGYCDARPQFPNLRFGKSLLRRKLPEDAQFWYTRREAIIAPTMHVREHGLLESELQAVTIILTGIYDLTSSSRAPAESILASFAPLESLKAKKFPAMSRRMAELLLYRERPVRIRAGEVEEYLEEYGTNLGHFGFIDAAGQLWVPGLMHCRKLSNFEWIPKLEDISLHIYPPSPQRKQQQQKQEEDQKLQSPTRDEEDEDHESETCEEDECTQLYSQFGVLRDLAAHRAGVYRSWRMLPFDCMHETDNEIFHRLSQAYEDRVLGDPDVTTFLQSPDALAYTRVNLRQYFCIRTHALDDVAGMNRFVREFASFLDVHPSDLERFDTHTPEEEAAYLSDDVVGEEEVEPTRKRARDEVLDEAPEPSKKLRSIEDAQACYALEKLEFDRFKLKHEFRRAKLLYAQGEEICLLEHKLRKRELQTQVDKFAIKH